MTAPMDPLSVQCPLIGCRALPARRCTVGADVRQTREPHEARRTQALRLYEAQASPYNTSHAVAYAALRDDQTPTDPDVPAKPSEAATAPSGWRERLGLLLCWLGIHDFGGALVPHTYRCPRCGHETGGHV